MTELVWLIAGAAAGSAIGAAVGWSLARRAVRRARLHERKERAAERAADLGAMTGGLAHEIKNPLSTIGLNAQLIAEAAAEIEEESPTDPEVKARLLRRAESLKREADRLRGILQDFLEYAGALRLDRRAVDVNELVGELADFFLPQAEQHGVRLRVDTAAGRVPAYADAASVKQAVLNLMLNAVQAFPGKDASGSPREVILRTRRGVDSEKTPTAVVHVIDTGPGIDAKVRETIFQPYVTTKPGGSGLGLPTTKRIVEAHGGRIEVYSEPGRGTDFALTLPGAE